MFVCLGFLGGGFLGFFFCLFFCCFFFFLLFFFFFFFFFFWGGIIIFKVDRVVHSHIISKSIQASVKIAVSGVFC